MVTTTVVGGSGFVGSAVVSALKDIGADVRVARAPRLTSAATTPAAIADDAARIDESTLDALDEALKGASVVINAAGVSDATSRRDPGLLGANALLPRVVRDRAAHVGAARFLHISTAAVQGRRDQLDESREYAPFSAYAFSKTLAEQALLDAPVTIETSVLRPTSVHGEGRAVTRALAQLARSPWSSVAGDGESATPQVLVENVGAATAFLAVAVGPLPPVVLQPGEGWTTASLLRELGGREPRRIPSVLARGVVGAASVVGRRSSRIAGHARRLEMLWFGQAQAPGWLDAQGWSPPLGHERWAQLARTIPPGQNP